MFNAAKSKISFCLPINKDATYKLFISAENNLVTVCINNQKLLEKTTDELGVSMQGGGRAAIFSGYYKNQFNNLEIKPIGTNPYIMRFDNLDDCFEYVENENSHWIQGLMESFKCYKRTVAHGSENSKLLFNFDGVGFNLCGYCDEESEFSVKIDGKKTEMVKLVNKIEHREVIYHKAGLENGHHQVELTVLKGKINLDSGEIIYSLFK